MKTPNTPKTDTWRERFYKRFPQLNSMFTSCLDGGDCYTSPSDIEDFIAREFAALEAKHQKCCEGQIAEIERLSNEVAQKDRELAAAREDAVKPYQEGIAKIAEQLRAVGLTKTADKIEADLATLRALTNEQKNV